MPGILPMKVIKVGNSAQSRIAQACDRCRSKKIRCDGVRPTCSQCANVGFECRTSDKLSRRAFPRGYTESLEERVRALETENRELKDLLDEKDEKIDMLSKMHGNHHSRHGPRKTPASSASPSSMSPEAGRETQFNKEDTFKVQAAPLLLGVENSDSYFMGPSSGRSFIEAFKRKVQETGKPCSDFNPDAFLHIQGVQPLMSCSPDQPARPPPRLFSDRCVNVYFQEWAPLFPVLHKPTFLHFYEDFVSDPSKIKSNFKTAQLYLVFGIAGLSLDTPDLENLVACEQQWTKALDSLLMENTMNTLQCLILALIYCTLRADYKRLQHYKGIAIGLSHRLGLHQSQKRFSFGALTTETRKKVFWTLYTLDCFTAATLGLPKLMKEDDVFAEYPSDTDDEYVTEKGFQPTLPGESTRLSSALALFRAARILSRVLEKNYPATTSHELSLHQMESLEIELNEWYDGLPAHLRLNFVQDKPSTDVTGSRSPLLALAYYFIRTLIYRPAVGSTLGHKAAPALMSIADSSKHMIQIIQLLEERNMIFSFCLNKSDLLIVCGMTLLYQVSDLKKESKLMREHKRLVNAVIKIVGRAKAPGSWDLTKIASRLIPVDEAVNVQPTPSASVSPREKSMAAPPPRPSPSTNVQKKKAAYPLGRHPEAAASDGDIRQKQDWNRRMTMPTMQGGRPEFYRSPSQRSMDSLLTGSSFNPGDGRISAPQKANPRQHQQSAVLSSSSRSQPNFDYLSLANTPSQSQQASPSRNQMQPPPTSMGPQQSHASQSRGARHAKVADSVSGQEWEALLGQMDGGLNNVYDAIYGGGQPFLGEADVSTVQGNEWSPDSWDLSNFNLGDFGQGPAPPQSVLSLSEESLSSGEDVAPSELGLSMGSAEYLNTNSGNGSHNGNHNGNSNKANTLLLTNCGTQDGLIMDPLNTFPI